LCWCRHADCYVRLAHAQVEFVFTYDQCWLNVGVELNKLL